MNESEASERSMGANLRVSPSLWQIGNVNLTEFSEKARARNDRFYGEVRARMESERGVLYSRALAKTEYNTLMGMLGAIKRGGSGAKVTQLVDAESGRVLGVGVVGPGAGELIAEGVLAIEMGAVASDLALSIHPHPTLSETLMEAAEALEGTATHIFRPRR